EQIPELLDAHREAQVAVGETLRNEVEHLPRALRPACALPVQLAQRVQPLLLDRDARRLRAAPALVDEAQADVLVFGEPARLPRTQAALRIPHRDTVEGRETVELAVATHVG